MQLTNPTAIKINQALQPVQNAANQVNGAMYGTASTPSAMSTGDTYQANSVPAASTSVPLRQFFDDPMRPPHPVTFKIADRLGWIGVDSSDEFLKIANTPFKRKMISYLAGGLFLGQQDRQFVNYSIDSWAGQADLMRTGADLSTARLMQTSGAGDVGMLSRYRNPIDKGVFYAAMSANALQYGYHMPSFSAVSQLIDRSAGIAPEVRWY